MVNFQGPGVDVELLNEMTACLSHRGPDDSGSYHDEHVGFGFRRLSIIDIQGGHQPMTNEDESVWVMLNGEIYNFQKLRDLLRSRGHQFKSNADTEVIVHGYEEWGDNCVDHFNGMFAFAVYDKKKRKVLFARDRLGIKPLYYAYVNGGILFGSEMKAILQCPEFRRRPNYDAISSYLTFRYPQGDQPVFDGMRRLPPGHTMEITESGHRLRQYWAVPFFDQKEDRGEAYYLEGIERLVTQAVDMRMMSDVPLGALLSGGLDSSIIVALMCQLTNKRVRTFSIGFEAKGYDEAEYANLVAKHCGAEHLAFVFSHGDYMEGLRDMILKKDAPLSVPHEAALYQICRELKRHITVVISGEGADELFGGYGRVQRSAMDYTKIAFLNQYCPSSLKQRLLRVLGAKDKTQEWAAIKSHMEHFLSVYNWMSFDEKRELFTADALVQLQDDRITIRRWEEDFEHVKGGDPYDRILYMFEKNHLICLLDRLDSMSMAAGVEARVPFVDHELVEFVSRIPFRYKMKWKSPWHQFRALFCNSFEASEKLDYSKHILRKFSEGIIPKEISYRKKLGFPVPLNSWIKDGMVKHVKEILLDDRVSKRGLFRKDKIERLINDRQNLDYDFWGKKIWMLMNVELWFQEFIDRKQEKVVV